MASQNVEYFRAAHQAFNRRDFDEVVSNFADSFTYRDHARDQTFSGPDGFKEFMREWVKAFSDGTVTDPVYIDGGDVVIAEFIGRGTNDGPLGPLPPTGKTMEVPFCEILRYNASGEVVGGGIYYDQLSIMTQLGHAQAPEGATADTR